MSEHNTDIHITVSGPSLEGAVFRAYGVSEDKQPLLIGVLEPKLTEMSICRRFSKCTLKNTGYYPDLPQNFLISANRLEDPQLRPEVRNIVSQSDLEPIANTKQKPPVTNDALINAVLNNHLVFWETAGDHLTVFCEFDKKKEMPLAFAFSVCTIEHRKQKTVACFQGSLDVPGIREEG